MAKRTKVELESIVEIPLVESAIDWLIQKEINIYNLENGTKFKDINSMQKYTRNTSYSHYDFAISVLDWNENVWEVSRQLQIDIVSGQQEKPANVKSFIAFLPTRV
ncbi:MAG: hypothetical protein L3I99_02020 [Sulfurimonas sp.]|nr:hypothetical protein [Sulfurimonas sp.]